MDSEERHKLKENDLGSWLQYGLPMYLRQNGSYIFLILALGFLGYQLYSLYERNQVSARLASWQELLDAPNAENPPAKILGVIENSEDKELKAQGYLDLGIFYSQFPLIPESRPAIKLSRAESMLKAKDAFEKTLAFAGDDALLAAKATLGLASVAEDRGNWDDARQLYQAIADPQGKFAGTPFVAIGATRLATLDDRRKAPRLVALMPPPAPPSTAPNPTSSFQLPDTFGPPLPKTSGPILEGPSTIPAMPFNGPPLGGAAPSGLFSPPPTPEAVPATATAPH